MKTEIKSRDVGLKVLEFASKVDIIVPFHGQYEKLEKLIFSILQLTTSNWYTLCLVDDCSKNENFLQVISKLSRKKNQAPIKCIRHDEQKGFGAALHTGFMATNNPWVIFMNSDCVVENVNWLKNLGISMMKLKDQGVKMISAKTNNPVNGSSKMLGEKGMEYEDEILTEQDGYLSFVCTMCNRGLFDRIGFIKPYPYGWFEDEEFAFRMRKHGYKQAVCGSSWVYHEGEATVQYVWRKVPASKKIMEEDNYQRCLEDIAKLENKN